jgi:hypothetical protein
MVPAVEAPVARPCILWSSRWSILVDAELPAEMYDSPTDTAVAEDHVAGLQAECIPGGT